MNNASCYVQGSCGLNANMHIFLNYQGIADQFLPRTMKKKLQLKY